jgi:AraC-like DNA-binding protein/mannose-6-phosphate isomerase-like protein (cupin superfamily)
MRPHFEPILQLANSSFKVFITERKEFDYPFHYHHGYELTYILSGSGIRYVGNYFEDFSEDELFMFGPGLPHCLKNSGQREGITSTIVIQWNNDILGEGWMDKKEFSEIRKLHKLSEKGIKFSKEIALKLKPLLIALVEERSSFEKIIQLVNILQHLSSSRNLHIICEEEFLNNFKCTDDDRLAGIYQYLETHFNEKITLSDMASLVYMTEESFSRFFSKLMKKTFSCFLNEYRINVAGEMLMETDMQIGQICSLTGFESISLFYRQFKRFKACSPHHYRKRSGVQESIPSHHEDSAISHLPQ